MQMPSPDLHEVHPETAHLRAGYSDRVAFAQEWDYAVYPRITKLWWIASGGDQWGATI